MAIAAAAVNNFKTYTKVVGLTTDTVYTAPAGYVGVFLLAQCANISDSTQTFTCYHNRVSSGSTVTTEIVKDFSIPPNDATSLLTGRLILETGDYLTISGSASTTPAKLKFITSILETSNQ
jgi:hypothetical protein